MDNNFKIRAKGLTVCQQRKTSLVLKIIKCKLSKPSAETSINDKIDKITVIS